MSSNVSTSDFQISPPNNATLTYSANSSLETPSVNTFITGIISAVTKENAFTLCGNCEEGASAFSKCLDCSDFLCDTCVRAHQRVRLTKDHKISRFINAISPPHPSRTESLGSSSQISTSPCTLTSNLCDNHREPHRYFCHTCHIPSCPECLVEDHSGHQLVFIDDAMEAAKTINNRLNMETRSAMITIRQAFDNLQRTLENMELRAIQAATEVRGVMRRYINAIEEREMELIKTIDQSRYYKGKLLTNQMDKLRIALSKLARTFDILNDSKDMSTYDIIISNDKAASELKQIRSLKSELVPCDENVIMFLPPDIGFLSAIASMGSVTLTSPVMPSIMMAAHSAKESQIVINIPSDLKETYIFHPKRNRPIFGMAKPVVVMKTPQVPSLTFASEGQLDGQLCRPWGVCCDRLGHIIVADRSNHRIQVFDGQGNFLYKFGSHGTAPGQFDRPAGIALNLQGNIVVVDKDNHRVQIFKLDGTFILTFGEKGSMNGQFNYPWDVACNSLNHIVVSDTRNHRIQLFTSEGIFLSKYGYVGPANVWKHFDSPRGVCFTPKGNIIVVDFNNHRLVVVNSNLTQAQFLGGQGNSIKQFQRPQGIICDDEGNIIVTDSKNNRIQVFEGNGAFIWRTGQTSKILNELDQPSGICLNPEGRIVVVDFGNNRIRIY